MDNVNTFDISKKWFGYVAENIDVKPTHTLLYFFIVNKWNSLFWKEQFGLPTDNTMQCINIRSYKTYIKTLIELEGFGFIKIVERSKNQNTSNIIEVVKNTKATTKATTKAMLKATTQSDYQSIDSIIKQLNNEQLTIKQINKLKDIVSKSHEDEVEEIKETIDFIYSLYPTKCPIKNSSTGKSIKCKEKIKELLKTKSKEELENTINKYLLDCKTSKTWLKNFKTFLGDLPDYSEDIEKDKDDKEKFVYYKWHNDGSDIKPRKIEKDKAYAFFENQLQGGYKAIIKK